MKTTNLFFLFGILQIVSLGFILFFILGMTGIGKDTAVVLSVLFPIFTLIVEYIIFTKK